VTYFKLPLLHLNKITKILVLITFPWLEMAAVSPQHQSFILVLWQNSGYK